MSDKEQDAHRLRVAMNLRGSGLDSLKPIGVDLANSLADFADRARFGEPDTRLDKAMQHNPDA